MLKHLLLLPATALLCLSAHAQFRYTFKDTATAYSTLTGTASLNGSLIWDEEDLSAPMPFSWKMDSTIAVNAFNLSLNFPALLADAFATDLNGFLLGDIDVADRGLISGAASLSPIRYTTTGTTPNRIFKLELFNAGFYNERDIYNTMADSFNLQVWVYETSNIVELHFGPSRITHPSDYWGYSLGATSPFFAYGKHVDNLGLSTGSFYHLKGNPAAPAVDTFFLPLASSGPTGINAWPANGTVYRFTPKRCTAPVANFTAGSPSGKTVQYTFTGTTPIDSLRWNFGDGTTAATLNPSHTFATDGYYNVCVTSYNSCASNTYCSQLALAAGSLAALGNVGVYPNPADNQLTIQGMQAGDKASVLSLIGQHVLGATISGNRHILDISALPAGRYMLLLSNKDGASGSVKFMKR